MRLRGTGPDAGAAAARVRACAWRAWALPRRLRSPLAGLAKPGGKVESRLDAFATMRMGWAC